MAVYETTLPSPAPVEAVFAYLADFRSAKEWDPSVSATELLTPGDPIQLGARFKVVAGGMPLEYEIVDLVAPHKVVLRARNWLLTSEDTVTFAPKAVGSSMTYHAVLTLNGLLGVADPLLRMVFGRVGDRAREGLAKALQALPAKA